MQAFWTTFWKSNPFPNHPGVRKSDSFLFGLNPDSPLESKDPRMTPTDQEILEQIRSPFTREIGFRQLIETYQRKVYHIIRRMVIIHEDADDLTQNTFIKAYRNLDKFEGNSALFTWLYRIATNESLSFLEKKKKRFFFSIDDHQEKMESYLDQPGALNGEQIQIRLQKALLKLPEKQRLVFHLKYQEELTYEEMAEITGTSVGALKASYHHAVKKIEQSVLSE
jgi:RNA polymerase sigma-70 factor (ECF subfamily)